MSLPTENLVDKVFADEICIVGKTSLPTKMISSVRSLCRFIDENIVTDETNFVRKNKLLTENIFIDRNIISKYIVFSNEIFETYFVGELLPIFLVTNFKLCQMLFYQRKIYFY